MEQVSTIGIDLALEPGADGRRLSFSLRPAWGAAGSAAERLVSGDAGALTRLVTNDNEGRGHLAAELGYGLEAVGGSFTLTPHLGFDLSQTAREWRLELAKSGGTEVDLGFDAVRREPRAGGHDAEHTIGLELPISW